MIQTINERQFVQAFHDRGRGLQFTPEGLGHIFDYLEQEDAQMELDVIAICCEMVEMSCDEVIRHYVLVAGTDYDTDQWDMSDVVDYLNDHTSIVAQFDDTIIFVQF